MSTRDFSVLLATSQMTCKAAQTSSVALSSQPMSEQPSTCARVRSSALVPLFLASVILGDPSNLRNLSNPSSAAQFARNARLLIDKAPLAEQTVIS